MNWHRLEFSKSDFRINLGVKLDVKLAISPQIKLWMMASFILLLTACQTTPAPLEEFAIARAALEAAKSVQAARHSPGYWHQADDAYRKGRQYYADRDYRAARSEFIKSRFAAEKAENSARLIRQKSGDIL